MCSVPVLNLSKHIKAYKQIEYKSIDDTLAVLGRECFLRILNTPKNEDPQRITSRIFPHCGPARP